MNKFNGQLVIGVFVIIRHIIYTFILRPWKIVKDVQLASDEKGKL